MIKNQVREQLIHLAEPDYKVFNEKLLPGVTNILGVRLPKLREIAKRIAKNDAQSYLCQMKETDWRSDGSYEEKMIYGLVIGYARMSHDEYKEQLDAFVPLIDSWGVCDSCCNTYKWMKEQPDVWWEYLNSWIAADTEYGIRFGLVSMLSHFVDEAHIHEIFRVCSQIHNDGYYAKMAAAWLVSVCFAGFPEETYAFLQDNQMDDFTHNKSIQKTCESYRVSKEHKALIRKLRRS